MIAEERVYSDRLLLRLLERGRDILGHGPARRAIREDWEGAMAGIEAGAREPPLPDPDYQVVQTPEGDYITNCPPPPDHDGPTSGWPGMPGYMRRVEREELSAWQSKHRSAPLAQETERRRFFGPRCARGFDGGCRRAAAPKPPSGPAGERRMNLSPTVTLVTFRGILRAVQCRAAGPRTPFRAAPTMIYPRAGAGREANVSPAPHRPDRDTGRITWLLITTRPRGHPALFFAALAALTFAATPALAAEATYNVAMTGAAEAPTPGDPAAKGTAKINVDDSTGYLCYELATDGLVKPTMAHIHKAAKGAAGPPVVVLNTPLGGAAKACAKVDPVLAKAILAKPSDYYVNVHNEAFPAGAIRAQLGS